VFGEVGFDGWLGELVPVVEDTADVEFEVLELDPVGQEFTCPDKLALPLPDAEELLPELKHATGPPGSAEITPLLDVSGHEVVTRPERSITIVDWA